MITTPQQLRITALSAAKYIAEIEALLESGVKQITLTRSQLVNLLAMARRTSRQTRNFDTGRLRRAMWRAEEAARKIARDLENERTKEELHHAAD